MQKMNDTWSGRGVVCLVVLRCFHVEDLHRLSDH